MGNIGDVDAVDAALAREFPRRKEGLSRLRPDFAAIAKDLQSGPVGPAVVSDPSAARVLVPIAPRVRPFQYETATLRATATGNAQAKRVTVRGRSIVYVFNWNLNNSAVGTTRILYAPTPEDTAPDPVAAFNGELAFQAGQGNCALLPCAGDWFLVFDCSELATVDTVLFAIIDASDPEVARRYIADTVSQPGDQSEGTGGGDRALAAGVQTLLRAAPKNMETAVYVQNVGAAPARVAFRAAGGLSATAGVDLRQAGQYRSDFLFTGPTLCTGDLYGFSAAGTTIAVSSFTRLDSQF
jgi:hypothetical protein